MWLRLHNITCALFANRRILLVHCVTVRPINSMTYCRHETGIVHFIAHVDPLTASVRLVQHPIATGTFSKILPFTCGKTPARLHQTDVDVLTSADATGFDDRMFRNQSVDFINLSTPRGTGMHRLDLRHIYKYRHRTQDVQKFVLRRNELCVYHGTSRRYS